MQRIKSLVMVERNEKLRYYAAALKYDTVEHRKSGEAAFRIREGKFKGIIYNYVDIKFPIYDDDGGMIDPELAAELPLRFNFDILSNPTDYTMEQLEKDDEFGTILGDILLTELKEALDRDALKFNYENRNNNTEQSTLQ